MSGDVELDGWLSSLGYALLPSRTRARAVLEAGGLTRPGKARMSTEKQPRAGALLRETLVLHCTQPECVAFAKASGRELVPCEPRNTCERCGGSDNARAMKDVLDACRRRRASRFVIVGGNPPTRQELERLFTGTAVELRLVDGTKARTVEHVLADFTWADAVLLWGATELHHKVSNQYQDHATGPLKRKLLHVPKRGISQLLAGLLTHLAP